MIRAIFLCQVAQRNRPHDGKVRLRRIFFCRFAATVAEYYAAVLPPSRGTNSRYAVPSLPASFVECMGLFSPEASRDDWPPCRADAPSSGSRPLCRLNCGGWKASYPDGANLLGLIEQTYTFDRTAPLRPPGGTPFQGGARVSLPTPAPR